MTTTKNTSYGWTGAAVKIVYRGLKLQAYAGNWPFLNSFTKISPTGIIYANNVNIGQLTVGVKTDVTVNVPAGVNVLSIIGSAYQGTSSGDCPRFTCESIEVYR